MAPSRFVHPLLLALILWGGRKMGTADCRGGPTSARKLFAYRRRYVVTYNGRQVDRQEYIILHLLSLVGLWCVTGALWIYLGALLVYAESSAEKMRLALAALSVPLWFASLWLVRNLVGFLVCGPKSSQSFPLHPRPNAPAHRERPQRGPSVFSHPQRGRDAVARLVRHSVPERLRLVLASQLRLPCVRS
jgi:hypothetical protein